MTELIYWISAIAIAWSAVLFCHSIMIRHYHSLFRIWLARSEFAIGYFLAILSGFILRSLWLAWA